MPSTSSLLVNKIGAKNIKPSNSCSEWGKLNNNGNMKLCPAKDAKCRKCGFKGHFALYRRTRESTKRPFLSSSHRSGKRFKSGVYFIDTEETEVESQQKNTNDYDCFKLNLKVQTSIESMDERIECMVGGVKHC